MFHIKCDFEQGCNRSDNLDVTLNRDFDFTIPKDWTILLVTKKEDDSNLFMTLCPMHTKMAIGRE